MRLIINIIDTFTNHQFGGNPAAVVITDDWLDEQLMQSIAIENNLSETAFVKKISEGKVAIRWFSPVTEIDFCGHAALASAFVLFTNHPQLDKVSFYAESVGEFSAMKVGNGYIEMNFPNRKPEPIDEIPKSLLAGLSIKPAEVLKNQQAYFAIYSNEQEVLDVEQDKEHLKKLGLLDVVVTAPAGKRSEQYDFVSRYFWPARGGDEDPATGSIHAGLAPYWAEKLGKQTLHAFQASQRGGVLWCRVDGQRVYVSGRAVRYMQGTIDV